jgi:hypothetical protein
MFAFDMTKSRPAQLFIGALALLGVAGTKDASREGSAFGLDPSLPFYLSLAPFIPTTELSVGANSQEGRKLQNTTGGAVDDSAASDDTTVEVYIDDLPLVDDAFVGNATFEELCPYLKKAVEKAYLGMYTCLCDANATAVVCATPETQPVQGAPNLKALVNNTVWFDDAPNATAVGDDKVPNIDSLRMCFDYRYVQAPNPQTEFPPKGCIYMNYSDDGKSVESCSATLTDPNRTLMNCSSCSGCAGGIKITLDCSNVNELAASDECYSMDGSETTAIFPDLVKSVGSGGAAIVPSLGWGFLLLLGHTAMLLLVHSS